jgi:hypothetical protein
MVAIHLNSHTDLLLVYKDHAIYGKVPNYLLRLEILREKEYCSSVLLVRPPKKTPNLVLSTIFGVLWSLVAVRRWW